MSVAPPKSSEAQAPTHPSTASRSRPSAPRLIDSADLFLGQSLVRIRHLGEIYRLQITRQGKLILTK